MFHSEQFRNAVISGHNDLFFDLLKKLIYSAQQHQDHLFSLRMIEEISGILKSQAESPVIKFKVAKIIMYIIVLAEPVLLQQLSQKIYPPIRNACLFNRSQPILTRGIDFFKNNKYYEIANFEEKTKLKNIGCKYILFCLECVYMLAKWLPNEQTSKSSSIYLTSYKMLLKQGVDFPNPNDFTFFTEQRIKNIEQQLELCQEQVTKIKIRSQEEYFDSGKNKFDAVNMNGVEYLQKKLKEKDKIIKDMKVNSSSYQGHRQSIVQKMKQQERDNLQKIEAYEEKVAHLTQEVREMKQMLKFQNKQAYNYKDKDKIADLEAKLNLLSYQNSRLKEELAKKSSLLSHRTNREDHSIVVSLPKVQSLQNIRELIEITKQVHHQTTYGKTQEISHKFEYLDKSTRELFYPIFDALSKESQIRLRRCLFKSKEVLYKDKVVEIGIISTLTGDIQLEMNVIITNLAQQSLFVQALQFQSTYYLSVVVLEEKQVSRKLKPGEQLKVSIKVEVNHIDSRCATFLLRFHTKNIRIQELPLILPVSKVKLMRFLPFTSFKQSQHLELLKNIKVQKKVVSSMQKFKAYLPKCHVQRHIQSEEYCYKIQFLTRAFFIKLESLPNNRLLIKIYFKHTYRHLAQKILDDMVFVLSA